MEANLAECAIQIWSPPSEKKTYKMLIFNAKPILNHYYYLEIGMCRLDPIKV